jgi:two-component sensor histidine kinase
VGDGLVQIDAAGLVTYASPNAVSAFHRLGVTANLVELPLRELGIPADLLQRLRVGIPVDNEIEANGAWMLQRLMPIVQGGQFRGAILLNRDITELRRRDRMLLIKDATIREIHHRVKNNLQTVASLLRLQARRGTPEARAELEESVRRIASIALVHETLSLEGTERVEFDIVAQRILDMVEASLTRPDRPIRFSLVGSAGRLPSDLATPLSLIIAELIQNAVDHAFPGRGGSVMVELKRSDPGLRVRVVDDGAGLPEGFDIATTTNLGLQIVRTLATELGGTIDVRLEGGSTFEVTIPFGSR